MSVHYRGEELRCPACNGELGLHVAGASGRWPHWPPGVGTVIEAGQPVVICERHGCLYLQPVRLPPSPEVAEHRARVESSDQHPRGDH